MSFRLAVKPKALAEFEEALEWYKQKRAGLDLTFANRVQEVYDQITSMPEMYAPSDRGLRKARVRAFPYLIIYRIRDGLVVVLAVIHEKRDPKKWQFRR
jgi:toxin ParE1/3/4